MTYTRSLLRSTCFALLLGTSACQWLIPEDQSAPRYNTVQGERHRPLKNNVAPTSVPVRERGAENMSMPAPVTPVAARELPMEQPVATQVIAAEQRMAQAPLAPLPLPPVSPDVQAKANAAIAKDPTLAAVSPRQVPVENREFTVAQSAGMGLTNVPPHPVNAGPDSPSARLGDARRDLEQSRADAQQAKTQLSKEVSDQGTAFPELAPLPAANAPVAPVPVVPAPQQQTAVENIGGPSHIAAVPLLPPPPAKPIQTAAVAPVPAAPVKPAAQPAPVSLPFSGTPEPVYTSTPIAVVPATTPIASGRSFDPMAPVPPAAPALKPIQLTAPSAATTAPVTATARAEMPAPVSSLPPTSSDFNPLAGAQAAPSAPAASYLPPSRYASRR